MYGNILVIFFKIYHSSKIYCYIEYSQENKVDAVMILEFLLPDAPLLREIAKPVKEFGTVELQILIENMFETMREGRGVGLAAPQVGIPLRVIVFEFSGSERAPDANPIPPTVLINPRISYAEGEVEDWEGCFSVPGQRGWISRPNLIHYQAQGLYGEHLEGEAEGFHARIIQHEIDHLNGILYPDIANRIELFERT